MSHADTKCDTFKRLGLWIFGNSAMHSESIVKSHTAENECLQDTARMNVIGSEDNSGDQPQLVPEKKKKKKNKKRKKQEDDVVRPVQTVQTVGAECKEASVPKVLVSLLKRLLFSIFKAFKKISATLCSQEEGQSVRGFLLHSVSSEVFL